MMECILYDEVRPLVDVLTIYTSKSWLYYEYKLQ